MPGFDRKGPLGEGPSTGGGFGRCNRPSGTSGQGRPADMPPGRGGGRGLRAGAGRCRPAGRGQGWGRRQPDGEE